MKKGMLSKVSAVLLGMMSSVLIAKPASAGMTAVGISSMRNVVPSKRIAPILQDTTPPTVIEVSPSGAETIVPFTNVITVTFSERINPETLTAATTQVYGWWGAGNGGAVVHGIWNYDVQTHTATFAPNAGHLPGGQEITVLLTSGIEDLAGNELADMSFSFTTISVN